MRHVEKKKAFCRLYVLANFVVNLVMVGLLELYWLIQIFLKTFAFYLSRIALISLIKNLTLFKASLDSSTILHHQNGFHILPKVLLNGFSLLFAKLSCRGCFRSQNQGLSFLSILRCHNFDENIPKTSKIS